MSLNPYGMFLVWMAIMISAMIPGNRVLRQEEPPMTVDISSPQPGQAIQGTIFIEGTIEAEGFQAAQLAFSYSGDPTSSWFTIATLAAIRPDQPLAEWDTSSLTDGNYDLRLVISLQGEEETVVLIPDLRVRNYTTIETNTPAPTRTPIPFVTQVVTPSPAPTPIRPSPTPLPPNPALITRENFGSSMFQSLVIVLLGFFILGIIVLRAAIRR